MVAREQEAGSGDSAASSEPPGAQEPPEGDRVFVRAMQEAELLSELDEDTLLSMAGELEAEDEASRRIQLLERYYGADGDVDVSAGRIQADRYVCHRRGTDTNAYHVVRRLGRRVPELGAPSLERVGNDGDSQLVLRAGEATRLVVDEAASASDGASSDGASQETVSVASLVRALNGLLAAHELSWRFVELRSDGRREAYVGSTLTGATGLFEAGCLEDEDLEELMTFGAW